MTNVSAIGWIFVSALLTTLAPAAHGATPQVVSIALRDTNDANMAGMVITADPAKVKAGRVTFEATNESKSLIHEVLVVPPSPKGKDLPYDTKTDRVPEKRIHSLGEISDLKPGAHGKLTLNLKPGTYILFCNQPGHYKSGMSTQLVVEK